MTASSSPVCVRFVPTRNCSVSSVAVEQPEDGLRVPDVDREQHGARDGADRSSIFGAALADALRERLGGQHRLVALAAQLLDRHVARGVDLGARDHPRRAVLVPHPDVLHLQVEERVARLRDVLEVELVAEVGRVLGQDAVAEEAEDRAVLLLQPQLGLGLELVELVEVAHDSDCSPARASATVPRPGIVGVGSELGERLEHEQPLVQERVRHGQAGLVDRDVAVERAGRGRSSAAPSAARRARGRACRSTSSSRSSSARGSSSVSTSATAFRNCGCSS